MSGWMIKWGPARVKESLYLCVAIGCGDNRQGELLILVYG